MNVRRSNDGDYNKWYARNSLKKIYRIINAFVEPAYISLVILHYGLLIYITLSISWLEFFGLVTIWILNKVFTYFTNRNIPAKEWTGSTSSKGGLQFYLTTYIRIRHFSQ